MAERLAEDLWRLDIPLVGNPLKNLNSYLLTGERSLLIDTGFRQQSCREAMERQLAETHVDRDRLDIFCTHLHSDHTGLAPELIRPGCRIYIGEIDSPGVKNASDPSCWKRLYGEYVRDGFTQAEMEALWGDNPAQTAAPPWREGLYTELQDGAALHPDSHDIVFDHVAFSYGGGEAVLKDVSFTANSGEILGIAGREWRTLWGTISAVWTGRPLWTQRSCIPPTGRRPGTCGSGRRS